MYRFLQIALLWPSFVYAEDLASRDIAREQGIAESQAENRLFGRIWRPKLGQQFQIVLSGTVDANKMNGPVVPEHVPIWDIDVFDNTKETITQLKRAGKKVICYFSAGTSEDWRDDYSLIKKEDQAAELPMWPGERWLDIRSRSVLNLMKKRIKYAAQKGCDAVDPDNMDGYENENGGGFKPPLTKKDSIKFMRQLSRYAHLYGMSIGLKNALDVLPRLSQYVEFAVNEECASEEEACEEYRRFLNPRLGRGKPVFHIEYVEKTPLYAKDSNGTVTSQQPVGWQIASQMGGSGISLDGLSQDGLRKRLCALQNPNIGSKMSNVIKILALDGWVMSCDGKVWETRGSRISKDTKDKAPTGNEAKGQAARPIRVLSDDELYASILQSPDEPFDQEFDDQLERELAGMDNTSAKRGAAKDRRGPKGLMPPPTPALRLGRINHTTWGE